MISWRMGGMMAAVASIFITPWNLFNNPAVIHYTLDVLGSFIGPLYGVLIVDFFLVKRGKLVVDDLYTTVGDGPLLVHEGCESPCGGGAVAGGGDRGALRDDAVARRRWRTSRGSSVRDWPRCSTGSWRTRRLRTKLKESREPPAGSAPRDETGGTT